MSGPFDLDDARAYAAWRERKLAGCPARVEELVVELADPRRLSAAERGALLERCRRTNMALYVTRAPVDKTALRRLCAQVGLERLDRNWLADEDGISSITPGGGTRGEFIPYTDRALGWHTDGVYNERAQRIDAMVLHCVRDAPEGGDSAFLDHELAYIALRDENPEHVRALSADDAMTIPARMEGDRVVRAAQRGPVFSLPPETGALHMRYTARGTNISWNGDAATRAACGALEALLERDTSRVLRLRLRPGMGIVCNNVLHKRTSFRDDASAPRLIFRARFLDRVANG